MNKCIKLVLLVLLVNPEPGFGQQQPASTLESLVAAAQQAQAAGNFAAAASDYQQAVRIEPKMPELWANLGLMQRQAGNRPGARQSFQNANRLNPSLYVPNLFLGIDNLREGKAAEAIPFLLKAEKSNKTDPQAPLALGRAYFFAGKYSAAAQELDRATKLDPKLGSAWFTLGIALLDKVEVDARTMSEEGKQSPFAGALFAGSLYKQSRFGEAASLYKTLIDSKPQPPCLRSELGFALLRGHDEPEAASQFAAERAAHPECGLATLGQVRTAVDSHDNEQAAKLLKELWDRDHGFVRSNGGVILEGLSGEKASALVALISAEGTLPTDLSRALLASFDASGQDSVERGASHNSGTASASAPAPSSRRTAEEYYAAGQFQQCALRLESNPVARNTERLGLLAACAFLTGDDQLTSSAATALQTMQPHSLEALYWGIQANERLAFKALARFQELEPDSAKSHVLLGDIYHQLERNDDAQAEYSKALTLAPNDPAAELGLATAYLSNNNVDGASQMTVSALAQSPEDPELNLIMAEVMLAQNQFADAIPHLEKSLHAKPQMRPRVHALIGRAYAELGRTEGAIDELKLGASSDEDGAIQYLLARLYRKLGDNKDAAEALDRMKTIKQQRRDRGVKRVEDPDLSSLEHQNDAVSTP